MAYTVPQQYLTCISMERHNTKEEIQHVCLSVSSMEGQQHQRGIQGLSVLSMERHNTRGNTVCVCLYSLVWKDIQRGNTVTPDVQQYCFQQDKVNSIK